MLRRAESLQAILRQPLGYLHPHRCVLPSLLAMPGPQTVLNRVLLCGLGISCPDSQQIKLNRWSDLWVTHWRLLPAVASLMGAQLMWPQLARGGRLRELNGSMRAFARLDLGSRSLIAANEEYELEESLSALGYGALAAWCEHIPEALMQRLPLQFSPRVVELQQAAPAQVPNSSLFILAVQHARIHPNPG